MADEYYSDNLPRLIHCDNCGEDYAATFAALREMGYRGRVTMEGECRDFAEDAAAALGCLKKAAEAC